MELRALVMYPGEKFADIVECVDIEPGTIPLTPRQADQLVYERLAEEGLLKV